MESFGHGARPKSVETFDVDRKNSFNFGEDLFFFYFGNNLILTEKPPQSNSKTNENLDQVCLRFDTSSSLLPIKPLPPLRNPGYANA